MLKNSRNNAMAEPHGGVHGCRLYMLRVVHRHDLMVQIREALDDCARAIRAASIGNDDSQIDPVCLSQKPGDDPHDMFPFVEAQDDDEHRCFLAVRDSRCGLIIWSAPKWLHPIGNFSD
jgi:hypothetical protein